MPLRSDQSLVSRCPCLTAVVVCVTRQSTLDTMPCILGGLFDIRPVFSGLCLQLVPLTIGRGNAGDLLAGREDLSADLELFSGPRNWPAGGRVAAAAPPARTPEG